MQQTETVASGQPLWSILAGAADCIEKDPQRAENLACAALRFAPGQQHALQILVAARRAADASGALLALLQSMAAEMPALASIHVELGLLLAATRGRKRAAEALARAVELEPAHPQAWRVLGDCFVTAGDGNGAARAYARHFSLLVDDLKTLEQLGGFGGDQIAIAEGVLREYLATSPTDLLALDILGKLQLRAGQFESAGKTFAHALAVDSQFRGAQTGLASAQDGQTNGSVAATPLSARLIELAAMLGADPRAVAARASELLDAVPGQIQTLFLLTGAHKLLGGEQSARERLANMAAEHPNLASLQYELGVASGRLGAGAEAVAHLSRAVELEPQHAAAWRALGDQLDANGNAAAAARAWAKHLKLSLRELKLVEDASTARRIEELPAVEGMLHQALGINPTDVFANRLLGEVYLRFGKLKEAEARFKRAVELAPDCNVTRERYALSLSQLREWTAANRQFAILLKSNPGNPRVLAQIGSNLIMLGEAEEATRLFETVAAGPGGDKVFWLNYAQAAKAAGKPEQKIIEAYRKCLNMDPAHGAAWWGLADMKTYRFSPADIAAMREVLRRTDVPDGQRCHVEFAMGKALEDNGSYAESFEHYSRANALRHPYISYSADAVDEDVQRARVFFTPRFFSARNGLGCPSSDPIFILGMPRAGSTLVEQILASHPLVEGTMELPELGNIVSEVIENSGGKTYPDLLAEFDGAALRRIGEDYLARTRSQRKLGRPRFTDKAGRNFFHTALIHLALPNAKIVDARRHPLACGFSCFKQAFAPGALPFAYDQTDIGRYYRAYAEIMSHIDHVLPGRVHRVIHEELVLDPEKEIRRLLDYCGLPFDEACLRFHETARTVRTASSLQVRLPIQKKAVEVWQHYEGWLQPMKNALGDVLTRYPDAP